MKKVSIMSIMLITMSVIISGKPQDVPKEINVELDRIGVLLADATLKGDNSTLLKYYTDDAIIMPDFIPAIRGINNIRKKQEENTKSGLTYHAFSGTVEKRWMADDMIYERGTFGMTVSSKSETKPRGYYGSYFQIWEKTDSGYKISFIIWNLDHSPY